MISERFIWSGSPFQRFYVRLRKMRRRQRPLLIRVLVGVFFVVLPQALIWLHKAEHNVAVFVLALISTLILSFALLKVLGIIFVLSPQGFAICAERMNRKTPFVFVLGSFHIVYALYQVGWTHVSIALLAFMGITEVFSFIGRARLARLDEESKTKLWIATQGIIRDAEQDVAPQSATR